MEFEGVVEMAALDLQSLTIQHAITYYCSVTAFNALGGSSVLHSNGFLVSFCNDSTIVWSTLSHYTTSAFNKLTW